MFIVASGHPRCLDRLLKAAAVPASIYNEAAYAVLLHLSLQGKGLSLAGSKSLSSAQPIQPSRALHSTTGLANDTHDSAPAASDDGVCTAPQRVGDQAASAVTPAAAAPQCADLASAVAATRKDLQDSNPAQPKRSPQPPPPQQQQQHNMPAWPSAMHEAGLPTAKSGTGRLQGIQQLLNKDLHRQELSDKVSKLQHKQQQQQGQGQPQWPQQEGKVAAQAVPAAQVAAHLPREEAQRRRALLREQLKAFERRTKPQPEPLPQPAQQQVQQEKPNAAGVLAAVRMPVKQQRQQPRQQQQQQAAQARPRHKGRHRPASTALPLLLQQMLLLESSHHAAAAAVAADLAAGSTSCSATCSSSYALGPVSTSQYSDWVELDTREVVNDGHDTFLGMWPDPSCLRPLVLYGQQQDDTDDGEPELEELLPPRSEAWQPDGLPGSAAAATADALAAAGTAQAADAAGLAAESSAGDEEQLLTPPAAADHAPLTFLERMAAAAAAALSAAAAAPNTPAFDDLDAAAAAADDDDTEAAAAAVVPESADAGMSWAPEQEAPMDMEALQQQALREAAAMAGCPELPSPAAADGYSSGADQPAKWSVANMFDAADAAAAGEQLQEELLEPDCWLSNADTVLDQLQHSWEPDSAGAVAAAAAAIRASNIRAAAAAAALPQLQWPQPASLLCAVQYAMQQLEREEQQQPPAEHMQQAVREAPISGSSKGTHHTSAAVGSSSTGTMQQEPSAAAGATATAKGAAAAAAARAGGGPASQPFAWMYSPQQAAAAAASGGSQVYGLQYILQGLNDQQQPDVQLLLSQQEAEAPPAPAAQLLAAPIQAPRLQFAPEDSAQPRTQQICQQQQPQQQSQQQPQQQPEEVPAWSQFMKDLWAAAKESYSFSSSTATSSDAAASSTATSSGAAASGTATSSGAAASGTATSSGAAASGTATSSDTAGSSTAASGEAAAGSVDTAGWQWDEKPQAQQQHQPHEAAGIAGDGFVLVPQQCSRSLQEQAVVARLAAMSAGTCLEPLLWSARENQHLQLLNQRAALAAAGSAAPRRHALSRSRVASSHQQQQQQAKPQGVTRSQQQQMAPGDWFASVLFAAHAALRQTGQLVLSPTPSAGGGPPTQQHSSSVSSSVTTTSSSSSSSSRSSSSKDHAGSELAAGAVFGLVAQPPFKAAWDPVSSSWEGAWLQPQYGMATADLQQHTQQPGQQQRQEERRQLAQPGAAAILVQPDAACGALLETIQACEDLAALQDTIQEYSHYLGQYPSLPAAVLQQAAGLLTAAAADSRQEGICSLRALASGTTGGAARSASAAAAGSSSSPALEADQTLQLADVLAAEPFNKPAAVVFEALVRLYTEQPPPPFDLLGFVGQHLGAGSSLDRKARGSSAAVALHNTAEGKLQLLLLGINLRGTLLPSGTSLLLLLQQLQGRKMLQQLQEGALAGLCEQLLSRQAALASWPAAEQQAASQLLLNIVVRLQPPSMLRLLQQLTQKEGSVQAMEMPQKLYRAAMAQLVKAASSQQAPEQFAQTGPQLLQLARVAALALGCLTMQAQAQGHVLPGGRYFQKSWQQRHHWEMHQSMVNFLNTQHKSHLTELQQWGEQPAASPEIAAEVMAAAASGHLQQVAGLLPALLQAGPAQQWLDAASAASLLHLLVCSSSFCTYSSKDDALDVAAVFGSITGRPNTDAAALFQGGQAMAALPGALFDQLLKRLQQGGSGLPPSAAVRAVWSAFELQYPQRPRIQALLDSICSPSSTRAATKAGSSKTVTGAGASKGLVAVRSLQKWQPGALHELLALLHWYDSRSGANAGPRFELMPHTLEAIAAAAAHQACKLTAELAARPANAGSFSSAGSTAVTSEVESICSIAMIMALRKHFNLPLLEALQDLLVAAAGGGAGAAARSRRSSGSKRGLASARQPRVFTRFSFMRALYALATFDAYSPAAASAVRRMLPPMLPWCREADLARIAWSLALLNECDWQLWGDMKQAIQHFARSTAAGARSNRVDSDEGAAEGDGVPGDMAAGGAADRAGFQAQAIQQQLHQAHIFVQHCVPDAAPLLPGRLAAAAQAAASQTADDVRVSQLQRDVGHMLGALQASSSSELLSYQLEHKTILGSTDIIVKLKGVSAPVAIEVDGPSHYPAGRRDQRLGSTVFRDRMLGANGFSVLALPYFVLDEAGEPGSAKAAAWLEQQLLQAAAAPTPQTGTSSSKPAGSNKPAGSSKPGGSSKPAGSSNVERAAVQLAEHLKQATAAAASRKGKA